MCKTGRTRHRWRDRLRRPEPQRCPGCRRTNRHHGGRRIVLVLGTGVRRLRGPRGRATRLRSHLSPDHRRSPLAAGNQQPRRGERHAQEHHHFTGRGSDLSPDREHHASEHRIAHQPGGRLLVVRRHGQLHQQQPDRSRRVPRDHRSAPGLPAGNRPWLRRRPLRGIRQLRLRVQHRPPVRPQPADRGRQHRRIHDLDPGGPQSHDPGLRRRRARNRHRGASTSS